MSCSLERDFMEVTANTDNVTGKRKSYHQVKIRKVNWFLFF